MPFVIFAVLVVLVALVMVGALYFLARRWL
jgi:Flp pilus assembly pilin Flp